MSKAFKSGKNVYIECPGCGCMHSIPVDPPFKPKQKWTWNNDLDNPTFSPSLHVNPNNPRYRCHSFIKNGQIQFLKDSYHDLKEQTVDLPEIAEEDKF